MSDAQHEAGPLLADLELQWRDHFHMRDQSWRSLHWTAALLVALFALKSLGARTYLLGIGAAVLWAVALLGIGMVAHHRRCQRAKFAFIRRYEDLLGLGAPDVKGDALTALDASRTGRRLHTQCFVEAVHLAMAIIGALICAI